MKNFLIAIETAEERLKRKEESRRLMKKASAKAGIKL
jgi:hypothetical protein